MAVVESNMFMRKFYYRYIHETLLKIKEKWWAYFASLARDDDEEGAKNDVEENQAAATTVVTTAKEPKSNITQFELYTSLLGTAMGLGQLWRFPLVAYKMGGGAFLIIYSVLTLTFGYSLSYLELATGQYASRSVLSSFKSVPIMQGLGYSMVAYSVIVGIYNSHMVGIGVHYFGDSFTSKQPWTHCPKEVDFKPPLFCGRPTKYGLVFITYRCPTNGLISTSIEYTHLCGNKTNMDELYVCCKTDPKCREETREEICSTPYNIPQFYYWNMTVEKSHVDHRHPNSLGGADLKLLLCSFIAWFSIYCLILMGMKWCGVATMFAVPFMFAALLLLTTRAYNNPDAIDGFWTLFSLNGFQNPQVWLAAVEQALYSTGIAMGVILTFGSLIRFKQPSNISPPIVSLLVTLGNIFAGAAVFCSIGDLHVYRHTKFFDSMVPNPGLAIIAYSHILSFLPRGWVYSSSFFFLFVAVGVISIAGIIRAVSFALGELFGISRKDHFILNFLIVFSCFLASIPFIMQGGLKLVTALDNIVVGAALPILSAVEILALFAYGIGLRCEDIKFMWGFYPNPFFRYTWLLWPIVVAVSMIVYFINATLPNLSLWTTITALCVLVFVLAPFVLIMIINICMPKGKGQGLFKPSPDYGPKIEEVRLQRKEFKTKRTVL